MLSHIPDVFTIGVVRTRLIICLAFSLFCTIEGRAQSLGDLAGFVEWQDTVVLQETTDVINVSYHLVLDPAGGFLLADASEGQFRRYDRDGALRWAFGQQGDGPNEFRRPAIAVRLTTPSHYIALLERQGKVAIYDEDGDSLVAIARMDIPGIQDAVAAPGGHVWVASATRDASAPALLHLIDPSTGQTLRSIFDPPVSDQLQREILYMNWSGVGVDPTSDALWAVTAARDTVYAVDSESGAITRRVQVRSPLIRPLTRISEEQWRNTVARRRWAENQSYLTDVFPLSDGRLLVLFQEFRNALPIWGLLLMDQNGTTTAAVLDTHRLLAVDLDSNTLVFQDANALEGNRLLVGRLVP